MFRLSLACALLVVVALPVLGQDNPQPAKTKVHLHWGARPGVSRYRLQLAADRDFHDIVFDRVVNGTEIDIKDLTAGKYFWRIAPLKQSLGEYSSAAAIDISASDNTESASTAAQPDVKAPKSPARPITTA